jgi:uncharacterized protein YndB with AHSA1/START domain
MTASSFVYVTFIRTSPEALWKALTEPEFTRLYWFGTHQESDWKPGAAWKLVFADGTVADAGEILEADPPRRLVLKWRNRFKPELEAEGDSRCTIEIEPDGDIAKLSIFHTIEREDSKLIHAVSGGWPRILSNLKTLLETGKVLVPADPA